MNAPQTEFANQPTRARLVAGRRSALPSARATLGALLVVAAGLLTYVAIERAHRPPTTRFAVALRDLAPGDVLSPSDVGLVVVDLPSAQRSQAIESDLAGLNGVTVLGPVAKGEFLQRGSLVRRTTPDPTLSFPIQAEHALAGRLRAGSRVDLYASDGPISVKVGDGLAVVRVDGAAAPQGTIVVTVALDPRQDQVALVNATSRDRLTIVEQGAGAPAAPVERNPTTNSSTNSTANPSAEALAPNAVSRTTPGPTPSPTPSPTPATDVTP